MVIWNLPAQWTPWIAALSWPLHGRLAWRLAPLLQGVLFARGRRTVALDVGQVPGVAHHGGDRVAALGEDRGQLPGDLAVAADDDDAHAACNGIRGDGVPRRVRAAATARSAR